MIRKIVWIPIALVLTVAIAVGVFFTCYPVRHMRQIRDASAEQGLSTALVCALVRAESRFRPTAESRVGAKGLMQLMPQTAAWIVSVQSLPEDPTNLLDVQTNLSIGCAYLRYLLTRFAVMETAVAAYNAGEGAVSNWLTDPRYSKDGATLCDIPYPETRQYVKKVMSAVPVYRTLLRVF